MWGHEVVVLGLLELKKVDIHTKRYIFTMGTFGDMHVSLAKKKQTARICGVFNSSCKR